MRADAGADIVDVDHDVRILLVDEVCDIFRVRLGGAVAEVLAEASQQIGRSVRFRRHALPDDYVLVAPPTHLYRHYGLTGPGVAEALKGLLA